MAGVVRSIARPSSLGSVRALLAMLHENFAAVILDIRTPGMGGIELVGGLRAHERASARLPQKQERIQLSQ